MPLKLERSVTAAFPCPSGHRQQTYLFHPRYRQTTRAAWSAHHLIRRCRTVAPLPVRQTALIESAVL
jgi:hypothetical protein